MGTALDWEKRPGEWKKNWAEGRVPVTALPCCFFPQLGFNIRGGKASQLGIFISKVCPSLCHSRIPPVLWELPGCAGRLCLPLTP